MDHLHASSEQSSRMPYAKRLINNGCGLSTSYLHNLKPGSRNMAQILAKQENSSFPIQSLVGTREIFPRGVGGEVAEHWGAWGGGLSSW
jgi:hypothetical protein